MIEMDSSISRICIAMSLKWVVTTTLRHFPLPKLVVLKEYSLHTYVPI